MNEGMEKILRDLEKIGYTRTEAVRGGLRLLYRKEFPVYGAKKIKKEFDEAMTPEEICEDVMGGEVIEENGVKFCVWKEGTMTTRAPLSAIRDQIK